MRAIAFHDDSGTPVLRSGWLSLILSKADYPESDIPPLLRPELSRERAEKRGDRQNVVMIGQLKFCNLPIALWVKVAK
jgi:hypothetical protein